MLMMHQQGILIFRLFRKGEYQSNGYLLECTWSTSRERCHGKPRLRPETREWQAARWGVGTELRIHPSCFVWACQPLAALPRLPRRCDARSPPPFGGFPTAALNPEGKRSQCFGACPGARRRRRAATCRRSQPTRGPACTTVYCIVLYLLD